MGKSPQNLSITHCTLDDLNINDRPYVVVIMGLSLQKVSENGWGQLYDLIDNSEKTVIEYSDHFAMAKKQLKAIKKSIKKRVVQQHAFNTEVPKEIKGQSASILDLILIGR